MRIFRRSLFLIALGIATPDGAESQMPGLWSDKVDQRILQGAVTSPSGETDFIILLAEQADLSGAAQLSGKAEKGAFVFKQLTATAERSQPAITRDLDEQGVTYETFWVANMIHVRGVMSDVRRMAERADVARVYANPVVRFHEPVSEETSEPATINAIESGISIIQAPAVWARGFTGQGIVIGGTDTGYRWTHDALKGAYRGWNGTSADHNYNWHDAIHTAPLNPCGANAPAPCDDNSHGTHTMGTMVGSDNGANQIGVAPGAKWIGCRNMDQGNGTPTTYAECLQWFIAPTDLNGNNPDPAKAPDVISNSWGCPPSEGCVDPNALRTAIESVRAAGIVVVASAGNSGSACSTVDDPPGIYEASLTVGATDDDDAIAGFSSRGPVTIDGSGRIKPNVVAPGVDVRSAGIGMDNSYGLKSGTSMSTPHVAGAVALILSAHPELKGEVEAVETLLEQSALRLTGPQTCGGIAGTQIPNSTFGWGRIYALAAVGLDDADGDGMEDWEELLAGTERGNPLSVLRITAVNRNAANCLVSFSTILNKRYRLERAVGFPPTDWETVADNVPGTGAAIELSDPNAFADESHFYRVLLLL